MPINISLDAKGLGWHMRVFTMGGMWKRVKEGRRAGIWFIQSLGRCLSAGRGHSLWSLPVSEVLRIGTPLWEQSDPICVMWTGTPFVRQSMQMDLICSRWHGLKSPWNPISPPTTTRESWLSHCERRIGPSNGSQKTAFTAAGMQLTRIGTRSSAVF